MECTTTCGPESEPGVSRTDPVEVILTITNKAKAQLEGVFVDAPDDTVLMVAVLSGGCSGYSYDLQVIELPEGEFQHLEVAGIPLIVHDKDSSLLNGIEIDFVDSLMGGGFKINNPNAERSCGCGMSFW
ncbi:MAG TPA: iron-sulfur cluster assembly accessory protein [Candidatus Poseidoniales archaeon]|nr:iron-sulfur cluster assembly accessory protein [Candidatus Poseidoniales archaeon]